MGFLVPSQKILISLELEPEIFAFRPQNCRRFRTLAQNCVVKSLDSNGWGGPPREVIEGRFRSYFLSVKISEKCASLTIRALCKINGKFRDVYDWNKILDLPKRGFHSKSGRPENSEQPMEG